ncbi:MAG: hypothetical protein WC955_07530 [Elusimicrobiota bacterium]
MNKINILWIDDEAKRDDNRKAINKFSYKDKYDNKTYATGAWKFVNVSNKENGTLEYVRNHIKQTAYDVIIVDHFLRASTDIIKLGKTWAGFLRENQILAPIICVTAKDNENKAQVSRTIFNEYDDLFLQENIGDSFENIFSIAVGFRNIIGLPKTKEVVKLLKVPLDDIEIIKQILPVSPIISLNKYNNARKIYEWFKTDFIGLPGLLYNRQWAANLIGIKEESFAKIENLFRDAEYAGIFSTKNNRRWWRSMIKDIVFAKTSKQNEKSPWEAGHGLKAITDKDFSICFKCKEKYPETMGYDDISTSKKFKPLHFRCSTVVEDVKKQLFFEEIRRMKTSKDK